MLVKRDRFYLQGVNNLIDFFLVAPAFAAAPVVAVLITIGVVADVTVAAAADVVVAAVDAVADAVVDAVVNPQIILNFSL
ncbi:hypothetical protein ACTXT7_002342 [Hymenolepis weldensis]